MIVGYLNRLNSGDQRTSCAIFDRMPERDAFSWTRVLVGYAKNGLVLSANAFCWTALISVCAKHGRPSEVLILFPENGKGMCGLMLHHDCCKLGCILCGLRGYRVE